MNQSETPQICFWHSQYIQPSVLKKKSVKKKSGKILYPEYSGYPILWKLLLLVRTEHYRK